MLSWGPIYVGSSPRITRDSIAFQVRPAPANSTARALKQRTQSFCASRVPASIQKIEIERTLETFDLNFRHFNFGFGQIIEHAWADQGHDHSDNADDHEHLDESETLLGGSFALPLGTLIGVLHSLGSSDQLANR